MKYPLIALPLSTLLVLTGCGGSGSGGDDVSVPTVTVTAPATAVTTLAFSVAWASTNATSCSSEFSDSTATSGSESITATEAGSTTYTVTCTGSGGTATGSATVDITAIATAQGLWQGDSTGTNGARTFGGVVTDADQYWLVYNGTNASAGSPAGFFVGTGATNHSSETDGTFTGNGLVEFNFEGLGAGVGTLQADFVGKSSLDGAAVTKPSYTRGKQIYSIDGVTDDPSTVFTSAPDPVTFTDGGTPWTITPNINDPVASPSLSGSLYFVDYSVHLEIALAGSAVVDITYPGRVLKIAPGTAYATNWDSVNRKLLVTGVEFQDESTTREVCTDSSGAAKLFCEFVPTTVATGDVEITFDVNLEKYTGVAHAHQIVQALYDLNPAPGGTCIQDTYSVPVDPANANAIACATATFLFSGQIPSAAVSEVTQNFTSTYKTAYDTPATLAAIAGSYSGDAGVDTAVEASSALTISDAGAITGTTTNCAVTGTVAVHGTKNVYDVTNLTFADNGGNTCPITGEILAGVATYNADDQKVTITATNDAKSQGFLYVGGKAQ